MNSPYRSDTMINTLVSPFIYFLDVFLCTSLLSISYPFSSLLTVRVCRCCSLSVQDYLPGQSLVQVPQLYVYKADNTYIYSIFAVASLISVCFPRAFVTICSYVVSSSRLLSQAILSSTWHSSIAQGVVSISLLIFYAGSD